MIIYMNPRTNAILDFKSGTLDKPLILDMYGKKFMLHISCHQAEMKDRIHLFSRLKAYV